MAEIVPDVYDIAQPTPIPLTDLSAIAISLEIWRNEIRKHRMNSTIVRFDPLKLVISSKTALPDLPSAIYDGIDEYLTRFGPSATIWLCDHYRTIFQLYRANKNSVLEAFDDFVADYCGTIDYVRTAKHMMACDRFTEEEKFAIACTYFFDEDIRRIWPSVCESFDLDSIDFDECPQLYYWICRLKNQLNKIPLDEDQSVDEIMLDHHMALNRPSIEYFWNRVSEENRMRKAMTLWNERLFISFALSKLSLNDQQLDRFANRDGVGFIMLHLFNDRLHGNRFVLLAWSYIKNKMNKSSIKKVVANMLRFEEGSAFEAHFAQPKNWLYICSEIWNSIPPNLKLSIVEDTLSDREFFEDLRPFFCSSDRRFVGFLLLFLSSATFEQRSTFWRDCWPHLIEGTRSGDLLLIMKLCFENEEKIAQFKATVLAESENVRLLCSELLSAAMFDELNDLVDFCWPEVQTAKNFKQQLLRSTFGIVGASNTITDAIVDKVKEFRLFIDDTLDSKDQSEDFKNQLISSSATRNVLIQYPCSSHPSFEALIEFVDTFVSAERTVQLLKMGMIDCVRRFFANPRRGYGDVGLFEKPGSARFLSWLFGSVEETKEFMGELIPSGSRGHP